MNEELLNYAGCDGLTKIIGFIIISAVLTEQICYGDYFVGNPRHTTYLEKPAQEREWTIID
jgi:hypothetical protein